MEVKRTVLSISGIKKTGRPTPTETLIPPDSHKASVCGPKSRAAYASRGNFAADTSIFRSDKPGAITDFVIPFTEGGRRDA